MGQGPAALDYVTAFANIFVIYVQGTEDKELVWDKDTPAALDFVTACANIRMYIFNIPQKSRYNHFCKLYQNMIKKT